MAPPFLTSALNGDEWSASRQCRFYPGEPGSRHPLDTGLGGPQSRSETYGEQKNPLALLRIEPSKQDTEGNVTKQAGLEVTL
jgi:hypothetical protein